VSIPEEKKANCVRVVCLLAIVIQACADETLWFRLRHELRPSCEDTTHPLRKSTAEFGSRFANVIAPPPPKTPASCGDARFSSSWFTLPVPSQDNATTSAAARRAWETELTELLLRLQTNLFYLDETMIGIFPMACQLEHACRPNSAVYIQSAESATLAVRTLSQPIRKGERVSFCYLVDDGDQDGTCIADRVPTRIRRQRIEQELGFVCHCGACDAGDDLGIQLTLT
jgi:hypothetical protein